MLRTEGSICHVMPTCLVHSGTATSETDPKPECSTSVEVVERGEDAVASGSGTAPAVAPAPAPAPAPAVAPAPLSVFYRRSAIHETASYSFIRLCALHTSELLVP